MEKDLKEQVRSEYREEVEKYIKYIPWLQQRAGAKALSIYNGEGIGEHSVRFPVYDGATLNFVKELSNSKFMDRNYPYVYSRNGIRTVQDEKKMIKKAGIRDMGTLCGILSKYVLGGMTKGVLWGVAVEEGIFGNTAPDERNHGILGQAVSIKRKGQETMYKWEKRQNRRNSPS